MCGKKIWFLLVVLVPTPVAYPQLSLCGRWGEKMALYLSKPRCGLCCLIKRGKKEEKKQQFNEESAENGLPVTRVGFYCSTHFSAIQTNHLKFRGAVAGWLLPPRERDSRFIIALPFF